MNEKLAAVAFAGLKNHESIAMGGRITARAPDTLEVEWMLYPDVLEGCPDRFHWDYGQPPLHAQSLTVGSFQVDLHSSPPRASILNERLGLRLELEGPWISREEGICRVTVAAGQDVRFYGLGEQFASLEHTGRRIVCESADWWNKNWYDPPGWKHSFAPIPFLLTTAGYGLLVHGTTPTAFDLREAGRLGGRGRYHIETRSGGLRITVICGKDLKSIVRNFLSVTGEPYVPPRWAHEPLLACACNHKERCWTEAKLDEYIEMFRKHQIPNGMVMDEAWIWTRKDAASPTGHHMHYEQYGAFEPDNYVDPTLAIARLEREGRSRMIFIIGPFIGCKSKHLELLKERGWLVRRASNPELFLMGQYNHYFLDFTCAEAVAWWQERLGSVLDLGVSGLFADFGEADEQADALYHHGGTGRSFGQEYNLLYKRAALEVLKAKRKDDFYFIGRAGWTGVQAICGLMQGDPACSFEGMYQSLISLQSSALSGQAVLSHNLGGYAGEQSALVYQRWLAFGIFCPLQHIWTSGESGGEPWNFADPKVLSVYRELMEWRMRLVPYLHSVMAEYGRDHIPLVRPMVLERPEDMRAAEADDQFFCGSEILVAPVLSPDGRRSVYLPAGSWVDFWTLERHEGPRRVEVDCPLERIPAYAVEGSIVPLEANPRFGRDLGREPLELHLFGEPSGRSFTLLDQGKTALLEAYSTAGQVTLRSEPLERKLVTWVWRGCDLPPASVALDGRPLALTRDGTPGYSFDPARRALHIRLEGPTARTAITIERGSRRGGGL